MDHEAGLCLDAWVYESLGFTFSAPSFDWSGRISKPETWVDKHGVHWHRGISTESGMAYDLMSKVWEKDPSARIEHYTITLFQPEMSFIEGPTFPVRVCRAVIFQAAQYQKMENQNV